MENFYAKLSQETLDKMLKQEPLPDSTTVEQVKGIRALKVKDIREMVKFTPRPFGSLAEVLYGHEVAPHAALDRGRGMLCILKVSNCTSNVTKEIYHMVALYRCKDGCYLFYDSGQRSPYNYPEIKSFLHLNNVKKRKVLQVMGLEQGSWFASCAYHGVTFMDYVSRLDKDNKNTSTQIKKSFKQFMGDHDHINLKVINVVQDIISEIPGIIDISLSGHSRADPVYIPPPISTPPSPPPVPPSP